MVAFTSSVTLRSVSGSADWLRMADTPSLRIDVTLWVIDVLPAGRSGSGAGLRS
jgi:hypothetical protein